MFRHCFIAGLRNMAANKLQTVIAVAGLVLGLAAAIIALLVIRNQLTYDSFLPSHERLYIVGTDATFGDRPTDHIPTTLASTGPLLAANFPEIEAVARVGANMHILRHGTNTQGTLVYSGDPNIFDLLLLPVLHGELKNALARPDAIVLPQAMARKLFDTDNVVGRTLTLDKSHLLRIAAVVADLPPNGTSLQTAVFVSGNAAWSDLAQAEALRRTRPDMFTLRAGTYVRLKPGVPPAAVQARLLAMGPRLLPRPPHLRAEMRLIPIAALNILPDYAPGAQERLAVLTAVAAVILLLSGINFVTLMTARAARRAREVGVCKALGADRVQLSVQFIGEAVLHALIALVLALALVEWLLPVVNAALNTGATLNYGANGWLVLALVAGTILVGCLAGLYPALLLSAFRPMLVLRSGPLSGHAGRVRQILVVVQFALLAVLAIAAGVMLAQYRFALTRTLANSDRVLMLDTERCQGSFREKLRALPGVEAIGCSDLSFIRTNLNSAEMVIRPDGSSMLFNAVMTGPGVLEMYGQTPLAGRALIESDQARDVMNPGGPPLHVLVNQTAMRRLGFTDPRAALGKTMRLNSLRVPLEIVGVVRDISSQAMETTVMPNVYYYDPSGGELILNIKLADRSNAAVLDAIAQEWRRTGTSPDVPFQRTFMNDWVASQRVNLLRQAQAVGVFAGIAIFLGCLGLFGLALAAAESRIKEIGVRKAMGAGSGHVLALLLWQFARPVLLANLIAWPLGFWLMQRWLAGFAYRIDIPLWPFALASVVMLAVALATVMAQAWTSARQKPVLALRYE